MPSTHGHSRIFSNHRRDLTLRHNFIWPAIPLIPSFSTKTMTANMCDFRFVVNTLSQSIYEISPFHILLYQAATVAFDCSNGQQILKGCTFCVMKIPCRCTVTSNNLYLPPRLGKCNNTDKISILNPINMALPQQFFNLDSHSDISNDTIFKNLSE